MNIYYFIHLTGTDIGISGIPRVVKNLGGELFLRSNLNARACLLEPKTWGDRACRAKVAGQLRSPRRSETSTVKQCSRADRPRAGGMAALRRSAASSQL